MKTSIFVAAAFFFSAVANAQTETPTQPQPAGDTSMAVLIDTSVGKAYVSRPDKLQSLTTETLTAAHIFPALGTFKASGSVAGDVVISLDETNKGMVWIDGLPQGRFKAIMKKAPATYKIPAQKSESGKAIAEGTLHVDTETDELTIVVGKPFNDANPASSLTITTKNKGGWKYTGVKAVEQTPVTAPASEQ